MADGRSLRAALPMNRAVFHRLGLSVGIAIALSGCDERTATPGRFEVAETSRINEIGFYRDPVTGCEYLVFDGYKQGGITPRLREDGRPSCPASAMSAGTAETQSGSGLQPASAVPKADAQAIVPQSLSKED